MRYLQTLLQDLRFGARQLRLNPGFTAVAALSLALGIGANTAIFQLVDAVRLRTIPVANPQELANIDFGKGSMRSGSFSTRSSRFTYAQWEQIRGFPHSAAIQDAHLWDAQNRIALRSHHDFKESGFATIPAFLAGNKYFGRRAGISILGPL